MGQAIAAAPSNVLVVVHQQPLEQGRQRALQQRHLRAPACVRPTPCAAPGAPRAGRDRACARACAPAATGRMAALLAGLRLRGFFSPSFLTLPVVLASAGSCGLRSATPTHSSKLLFQPCTQLALGLLQPGQSARSSPAVRRAS